MKLENDHMLHRKLLALIKEVEIEQEWIDDDTVFSKITDYEAQCLRDSILNEIMEAITENYMYYGDTKG